MKSGTKMNHHQPSETPTFEWLKKSCLNSASTCKEIDKNDKVRHKCKKTPNIFSKNKTKMVLWLVSHCETVNNREQYAEELGKYIDVDIFGKCSKKTCDGENTRNCISNSSTDYKFYLAFENSNCYDYITEKYDFILSLIQTVDVSLNVQVLEITL